MTLIKYIWKIPDFKYFVKSYSFLVETSSWYMWKLANLTCDMPIEDSKDCVLCNVRWNILYHLFSHCDFAYRVWYEVFQWLGVVIITPSNLFILFKCFSVMTRNNKVQNGYWLILHTTILCIRKTRNGHIFLNETKVIKSVPWKWGLSRLKMSRYLFWERFCDLDDCLSKQNFLLIFLSSSSVLMQLDSVFLDFEQLCCCIFSVFIEDSSGVRAVNRGLYLV